LKIAVIYTSLSGFTQTYAQWLAEDLQADIFNLSDVLKQDKSEYSIILYGGSLHAVGINGLKRFFKNFPMTPAQQLVVFATGASPLHEGMLEELRAHNLPNIEESVIPLFYLRGGFDYKRLGVGNKILMALLKLKIKSKRHPSPDERGMLAAYNNPVDFTKRERIQPIVNYINSIATRAGE
jgi:hypothetical protein